MKFKRLAYMIVLCIKKNGYERATYLKKHGYFSAMGDDCFWQPQYLPPEPELIKLHDNVVVASNVYFITHDVAHYMLSKYRPDLNFKLNLGAIEVGSNVFIGSNTTILPGTIIEGDAIIGAGSVVTGNIRRGGVYAGVPAKRIEELDEFITKRQISEPEKRSKKDRYKDTWKEFYLKWKQ